MIQVGDIVSVIDMPPKEDTGWWRGKHGFQVNLLLLWSYQVDGSSVFIVW